MKTGHKGVIVMFVLVELITLPNPLGHSDYGGSRMSRSRRECDHYASGPSYDHGDRRGTGRGGCEYEASSEGESLVGDSHGLRHRHTGYSTMGPAESRERDLASNLLLNLFKLF